MAGWERPSVAEPEPGPDSELATKPELVTNPKSISNPESYCESTYEPPIEPESIADSESPNELESRAHSSDDLSGAQKSRC